jgi:hypothetical protein
MQPKRKRDEENHVGLPLRILMLLLETFQRSDRDQQANSGTVQRRRKIESERLRKSMRKRNHQSMQYPSPRIHLFARFIRIDMLLHSFKKTSHSLNLHEAANLSSFLFAVGQQRWRAESYHPSQQ